VRVQDLAQESGSVRVLVPGRESVVGRMDPAVVLGSVQEPGWAQDLEPVLDPVLARELVVGQRDPAADQA
jgi:hypothetical protein